MRFLRVKFGISVEAIEVNDSDKNYSRADKMAYDCHVHPAIFVASTHSAPDRMVFPLLRGISVVWVGPGDLGEQAPRIWAELILAVSGPLLRTIDLDFITALIDNDPDIQGVIQKVAKVSPAVERLRPMAGPDSPEEETAIWTSCIRAWPQLREAHVDVKLDNGFLDALASSVQLHTLTVGLFIFTFNYMSFLSFRTSIITEANRYRFETLRHLRLKYCR